jgi:hypothetical protein
LAQNIDKPKVSASAAEMQALRAAGCIEPTSKKANLICTEDLLGMLQAIKKWDLVLLLQHLLSAPGNTPPFPQAPDVVPASIVYAVGAGCKNIPSSSPARSSPIHSTPAATTIHVNVDADVDVTGVVLPPTKPVATSLAVAPILTCTATPNSSQLLTNTPKTAFKKYSLDEGHFPPTLELQLAQLQAFWMSPSSLKRQQSPVNIVTYNKRR